MKYLLDTHIWIWSISEPEKLSNEVREILEDPQSEVYLSSISIWEFLVLLEKRRISIESPLDEWLESAIYQSGIIEIPIDSAVAIRSRKLTLPHQDPADRFIAASALTRSLKLITSDGKLASCPEISVLYNK